MPAITIQADSGTKFLFSGIVLAMASFPIFWVFTIGEGSITALVIAVSLPTITYLYLGIRNQFYVQGGKLGFKGFFLNKKAIEVAQIVSISSRRDTKSVSLIFKSQNLQEYTVSVQIFSMEQIAHLIYVLQKENPKIVIPDEFSNLVRLYGNEAEFKAAVKNMEAVESKEILSHIAMAAGLVLCFWLYMAYSGGEYSMRDLADTFVNLLH